MASDKPSILIANDDGIDAPGIQALHAALRDEYHTLVVAPRFEKSGAGCSLSLSNEMQVDRRRDDAGRVWGYAVDGTPADCVKFALTALQDFRPDLVLSGVNRGVNLGNSVFYSGTVAAAIEATFYGVPAMAASLGCWGHPEAFFDDAAQVVRALVPFSLGQPRRPRCLWNLNIPNRRLPEMGALRLSTHGTSFFEDEFELYRENGDQLIYRNIGSMLQACAIKEDADDRVWAAGEVSLSLLHLDLTAAATAEELQEIAGALDSVALDPGAGVRGA